MRWWARSVVLAVAITIILASLSFWTRCGDDQPLMPAVLPAGDSMEHSQPLERSAEGVDLVEMQCIINEEYSIGCKASEKEVYIPFKFIKKYFEVYGDVSEQQGQRVFRWSHSYGQLYPPSEPYRSDGEFMYFGTYNVEKRDRVKCVSGAEGVPVTTQWLKSGFFYPVQIAQFGLSHFSRNLTEPPPSRMVLIPARIDATGRQLRLVRDERLGLDVVELSPTNKAVFKVDQSGKPILIFDLKVDTNATIAVDLMFRDAGFSRSVRVHYVCSDVLIISQGSNIFIGLGSNWRGYKHFIRDLSVDALKGIGGRGRGAPKLTSQRMRVQQVRAWGAGRLRRLELATSEHRGQFLQAADWLVKNQAASGAWTIPVQRRLNDQMVLRPQWSSAMGQGQAMSLLTRAYRTTGDGRYLEAARRATAPFSISSRDGGVLAMFQEKYVWYEEYPTVPASLVLNGFIYSLMGLYDLAHTKGGGPEAGRLYSAGLESLRALLPLFDTGSGTLYDLRHVTCHVSPNLARWDYHVTHVNQLLVLATMEPDEPLFAQVAARWTEYMRGHRAAHN